MHDAAASQDKDFLTAIAPLSKNPFPQPGFSRDDFAQKEDRFALAIKHEAETPGSAKELKAAEFQYKYLIGCLIDDDVPGPLNHTDVGQIIADEYKSAVVGYLQSQPRQNAAAIFTADLREILPLPSSNPQSYSAKVA